MSRFLGIGMTHYPLLAGTDAHMAGLLRWTLLDPDIPDSEKDPANWPAAMRAEWGDDQGRSSAAGHRAALLEGLRRCREALDAFEPDVLVVWGDDQYENFREEVVPPFCVLAYDDLEVPAFEVMNERGSPNAWGLPEDFRIVLRGDADSARELTEALVDDGVDMAYSYHKRRGAHFPHAILNTQLFLDYAHAGAEFPYRLLPITVNCYGQHAIARKGGLARFADIADEKLDPSGPSPARCMQVGRAIARHFAGTDQRVAFVASSSWSHAFLADALWHIRPDTPADERLYRLLTEDRFDKLAEVTSREVVEAGQHEILNWFCLFGAIEELGLNRRWSTLVTTDVFNSNKPFALYS
ncbi:2,3-dihydroxy-p-cumate dioxygenase [Streptomyces albus]|uniref:2,3-dihydroxy-p-cumate dioxygenase n=1 Tax=Streptomyces albus (strain ATCC 21838 / DSM 41398 / FERM P-419 / JCM 4703 / NBRC 107858) TaxID=1081613 RepID=A0A0B5F6T7_STRA4|nr:2,3-dihydroxy-p-cumate dioxygenase [Streptomyces albus]AOU81588.1 2,3-dihydroxy-p-cumate dioxygenase [Streptomyces albus]AYN37280.1 extradiol ring-cleavage dioxygenase [Streptomyces albus]